MFFICIRSSIQLYYSIEMASLSGAVVNYIAMTVTHVEHHRPHHSSKLHWDTVEVLQLPVPVVVVEIDAIALEHASCRDQVQGYQEQGKALSDLVPTEQVCEDSEVEQHRSGSEGPEQEVLGLSDGGVEQVSRLRHHCGVLIVP